MPLWVRLIFAAFGALFAAGSVAWYVWASGRVAEARDWPQAQGIVVESRVREERSETRDTDSDGRSRTRITYSYYPVVNYTYRVGGRVYGSDAIWLADSPGWSDPTGARDFLADYPRGGAVSVTYNPADPSDAALLIEPPTPLIFIVTAMGLIFLAVAWFMPREQPDRSILPAGAARRLLRNRRRG